MNIHVFPPLALLLLPTLAGATGAQDDDAASYRRIAVREAIVRNLADESGVEILRMPRGGLVRVRSEVSGWLSVEAPGGFPVWIFGRYLTPTTEPDVLEVTGNAVNLRPRPKSDVNSFPLPQRLHAGDRVRVIEVEDPNLPLAETWVRAWSPEGVRAYVRSRDVEVLGADEDGPTLWSESLTRLPKERAPAPKVAPPAEEAAEAQGSRSEVSQARARKAIDEARARLEAEKVAEQPDFAAVRTRVAEAQELDPGGALAVEAQFLLEQVTFYEELAAVRSDLESRRTAAAGVHDAQLQELEARVLAKDPLRGAFLSRGVLVRRLEVDGTPRFHLYFGGRTVSEVVCTSGRYDLTVFSGYEVGVQGSELAAASAGDAAAARRIDVDRLEVIKRR